jgi:hypothetical protein
MSKLRFTRFGLAVVFLCSVSAAAFAAPSPAGSWSVAPIAAKGSDGGSFCSMKATYPDGQSLVFARESMGENSIAIDFQKNLFQVGDEYEVKVQSGSVVRPMAASASSKQVLVMQTGIDTVLYGALARKHTVDFTMGRKTYSYELDVSAADALAALEQCVENLQASQPFRPVSYPLGTVHPASLQQVAADFDEYTPAAPIPGTKNKKKHKKADVAAAPADSGLQIEIQDPTVNQGGEPTPSDLARDGVKTEIAADLLKMTGGGDIAPPPAGGVTSPPAQPVDAVENETLSDAKAEAKTEAKTAEPVKTETPKAAAVVPVAAPAKAAVAETPEVAAIPAVAATPAVPAPAAIAPAVAIAAAIPAVVAIATAPEKTDEAKTDKKVAAPVAQPAQKTQPKPDEKIAEVVELPPPAVAAAPPAPVPPPVIASEPLPPPSPPAYLRASSPIGDDINAELAAKKAAAPMVHPTPHAPMPPPDNLDLKAVLTSSHVLSADQIKVGDNNALSWTSADGLYGSAEQLPLPAGKNLTDTANDYLHKTAALCKGDFAQKIHEVNGSGKMNALEADITCLDGENNPAAAVLFISKQGMYSIITQEGTIDQLHNAMTNRDAILSAALAKGAVPATSAKPAEKPIAF